MYDNLMDKDHAFALGFVSVSVPISGWWGGSHDVKKQSLMVKNAENTFSDASELLVISMQKAWNDLQDAYKQMGIAANSIEQSAENLRLNEDYYRAGTTTMSDLLDAETLYQQSRDKYVDAFSSFRIKEVEYLQATGR
jgi:outer membrane protein TolC